MLDISTATQVSQAKSSNEIIAASSNGKNTQEPSTERFDHILEREVVDMNNPDKGNYTHAKSEKQNHAELASPPQEKFSDISAPVTPAPLSDTSTGVNGLFLGTMMSSLRITQSAPVDTTESALTNSAANSKQLVSAGSMQLASLIVDFDESTKSILPPPLTAFQLESSATSQPKGIQLSADINLSTPVANALTSNTASSPGRLLQSVDTANSAVYGKFLPSTTELSEALPITKLELHPHASVDETHPAHPTGLTHAASVASPASQNSALYSSHITAPVGHQKWDGEFAQKIIWMTTQNQQVAEIRLNPAHLGPIEVIVNITQDQATAQFVSPYPAVREAIEAALPKLREMMADSGIQLGNVTVGSESFQQEHKQQEQYTASGNSSTTNNSATSFITSETESSAQTIRHGLVNTYA